MSVDGRDESLGDGDAEAGGRISPQVPSQGGRASVPQGGDPVPGDGGVPVEKSVPAQRDWREDSLLPPLREVPPADPDLIARMRSGDDTAYEELYRRHADAVRRYARTCCRDGHTADDLTAEVFARMLQAVRRGSGPEHAVRAYLLTSVRRVAAGWTQSAKREQLVDDFALFAAHASRTSEVSDDDTLDLGADVLAMHEAEQSMAMQAFRSLPERWQAVLWHTEVEDESPSEVATLFGLDANGTRVLASRAREGLKQAYLQAHVSATLTSDEECARYADQLGTYARRRLRTRAERGLRKHLDECAKCRLAALQIEEVAGGIPAVVPIAVIGWFGAAGYAKAVALIAGGAGAGAAGAAGAAAAASGGTGGSSAAWCGRLGGPGRAGEGWYRGRCGRGGRRRGGARPGRQRQPGRPAGGQAVGVRAGRAAGGTGGRAHPHTRGTRPAAMRRSSRCRPRSRRPARRPRSRRPRRHRPPHPPPSPPRRQRPPRPRPPLPRPPRRSTS